MVTPFVLERWAQLNASGPPHHHLNSPSAPYSSRSPDSRIVRTAHSDTMSTPPWRREEAPAWRETVKQGLDFLARYKTLSNALTDIVNRAHRAGHLRARDSLSPGSEPPELSMSPSPSDFGPDDYSPPVVPCDQATYDEEIVISSDSHLSTKLQYPVTFLFPATPDRSCTFESAREAGESALLLTMSMKSKNAHAAGGSISVRWKYTAHGTPMREDVQCKWHTLGFRWDDFAWVSQEEFSITTPEIKIKIKTTYNSCLRSRTDLAQVTQAGRIVDGVERFLPSLEHSFPPQLMPP